MVAIGIGVGVGFGGAVGPAPFSPLDLSPALWLDASDTSTITASSGAVSEWRDKSGNARHVSQGTAAAQPTTATATLNGLNVLSFDGGDSLAGATASDWTFMHDGTDYVVAAVVRVTSATGCIYGNIEDGGRRGAYAYVFGTQQIQIRIGEGAGGLAGEVTAINSAVNDFDTTWNNLTIIADPNNATAANRMSVYVDNGSAIGGNARTTAPSSSAPNYAMRFGATSGNLGTALVPITGTIAEIVIVSGANATEANRVKLRDYLAAKWGL